MLDFFRGYRENGFKSMKIAARELAEALEIPASFPKEVECRRRKVKKQFDHEGCDEPIHNIEKKFQVEFSNCIVDKTINAIEVRFEELKYHGSFFEFLYNSMV